MELATCACGKDAMPQSTKCEECDKRWWREKVERITAIWEGKLERAANIDRFTPPGRRHYGATWQSLSRKRQESLTPFIDGEQTNLLVHGPPGTGKTWICRAIEYAMLVKTRRDPTRVRYSRFLSVVAECSRFGESGEYAASIFDQMFKDNLLVIDDIAEPAPTNIALARLVELLDCRWERCIPTVVSCNISMEALRERLGDPMLSRLTSGIVLECNGADRRKAKE